MNKLSRRKFLQGLGLAAAGAAAVACQPKTVVVEVEKEKIVTQEVVKEVEKIVEVTPTPAEVIELACTHAWDSSFWPRQEEFDKIFNLEHPGIKMTPENVIWGEYVPKLTTLAAADEMPELMYCQFAWAQRFIMDKAVLSLQPFLDADPEFWGEEDFNPESLKSYRSAGDMYFIPYDEGPTGLLFYNKDLFDDAGVDYPKDDWNVEDLLDAALELTGGEGEKKTWGYDGLPTMGGVLNGTYLYAWDAQWWVEPCETESEVNSDNAVECLEWWLAMRLEHKVTPTPAEAATLPGNAFAFGRQAMMRGATWNIPWINASLKANWDIAHWPYSPLGKRFCASLGSGYGITKSCAPEKREAAYEYIRSYLSTEGQIFMWASTGRGSPARWSAWDAWMASPLAPESANVAWEELQQYAVHDALDSPHGREISDVSGPIWDRAMLGEISVREALDQIQEACTPVMEQNADWARQAFPGECA